MSPIANYTTEVTAQKSIGELTGMLVAHGATHILTDYKEGGEPVGIAFMINTPFGERPFRLPANVEKVEGYRSVLGYRKENEMTTSSPIRKIHQVPIIKITSPQRILPAPSPNRLVPLVPIRKRETVKR